MARLISAVFNGGHLYQPKIIKAVGKGKGWVQQFTPTLVGEVEAKGEYLEMIKQALIGVVHEPRGTGSKARVRKTLVAGKTGTAQVVNLEAEKSMKGEGGVPAKFRDHAWFVAIAPADNPQLALAVLVENGGHGGSAAAPIAREMIKAYLGKN